MTYRIKAQRDYYLYIYGLNMTGIQYTADKTEREIRIPAPVHTEVMIMKDQLLSDGYFTLDTGNRDLELDYTIIEEIDEWYICKIDNPNDEQFYGTSVQAYVTDLLYTK